MPDSPTPTARSPRPVTRAHVETVERLSPHMLRVVVSGDELRNFGAGAFTDHYVKLQIPPPGAGYRAPFDAEEVRATLPREQWPHTRTYTVRAWDPDRRRLTIDFVHHGDVGVAGPWAASAKPGDILQFQGPGGAYTPDPQASWHLMVGDASVLPAITASLLRVGHAVPVHVVVEVAGPAEELELQTPGDLHLAWLHRDPADPGGDDRVIDTLRAITFPVGQGQVFAHGEASAVRAVRRHLLVERQMPREALSISGYWKRSRTEEGWREEKAEWNRQVELDAV